MASAWKTPLRPGQTSSKSNVRPTVSTPTTTPEPTMSIVQIAAHLGTPPVGAINTFSHPFLPPRSGWTPRDRLLLSRGEAPKNSAPRSDHPMDTLISYIHVVPLSQPNFTLEVQGHTNAEKVMGDGRNFGRPVPVFGEAGPLGVKKGQSMEEHEADKRAAIKQNWNGQPDPAPFLGWFIIEKMMPVEKHSKELRSMLDYKENIRLIPRTRTPAEWNSALSQQWVIFTLRPIPTEEREIRWGGLPEPSIPTKRWTAGVTAFEHARAAEAVAAHRAMLRDEEEEDNDYGVGDWVEDRREKKHAFTRWEYYTLDLIEKGEE